MEPFDHYPRKGKQPLGIPPKGNNIARRDYGPYTFQDCGYACAYCGQDLGASYESWLSISVDHVVPISTRWYEAREGWIEDRFNRVTCCRACNEFLNAYRCRYKKPNDVAGFVQIRDKVFLGKRQRAKDRHQVERTWYRHNVHTP